MSWRTYWLLDIPCSNLGFFFIWKKIYIFFIFLHGSYKDASIAAQNDCFGSKCGVASAATSAGCCGGRNRKGTIKKYGINKCSVSLRYNSALLLQLFYCGRRNRGPLLLPLLRRVFYPQCIVDFSNFTINTSRRAAVAARVATIRALLYGPIFALR